jgi:membrane protein
MLAELAALELHSLSRQRVKRGVAAITGEFARYDLLTYSSAIAFQVLYAVIPLVLLALAALGLLGLESVYTHHVAPTLRRDLSSDAFVLANRTALHVMNRSRGFWLTAGAAVTIWGVGAAVRATMTPLNGIYGARESRSWGRRLWTSLAVAALVIVCVFAAIALVLGGRLVHPSSGLLRVGFLLLRWVVTVLLLLVAFASVIRFAPAARRPVAWVSIGSLLATVCWIVASIGYAAYISGVSYSSFYGALAGVVLLLIYVHVAAIAFLLGVVTDSQLRELVAKRERQLRRRR